ncbi:uncharacterized protein C8Q71DRAFT_860320 [Rhodofomes roseus]|uniref:PB1 domain-containing protein n=1 Tax=Rhodofomes roseus TaxID=34475 RepID=A0ABQ8K8M0_9APHY|nr:uncharacterized protein C8Q71DRAFT_860320 [Rhodofomes roseus]KAH9833525.1 hypothetical protein C8Q71DRAFT_860320 [Rhodofomes roseus]
MSTPQFHIKLSQPHGFTRAVLFTAPPTWDDLTSRIKSFFDIPEDRVALAYVDADGDEVTLNSQHELHELFTALRCDTNSTTLKFAVRDMRDLRQASFSEDTHHVMSAPDVTVEHDGEPQVEPTIAAEATAGEHAPPHTDDPSLPGRPAFSMASRGSTTMVLPAMTFAPLAPVAQLLRAEATVAHTTITTSTSAEDLVNSVAVWDSAFLSTCTPGVEAAACSPADEAGSVDRSVTTTSPSSFLRCSTEYMCIPSTSADVAVAAFLAELEVVGAVWV